MSRDARQWVDWMLAVTEEAVRVSRGLVLWVCAGVTRDHCYWPSCEGLLWEWWMRGGKCWRPCFWHRVGIPGSGGRKWLRADVEYVLCFKGEDNDFWTDNTAMGHPPKWTPGGEMSHRLGDGQRVNQWGMNVRNDGSLTATNRGNDGELRRRTTKPSHVVTSKNAFGVRTDVPIVSRGTGRKDPEREGYRAGDGRLRTNRNADGTMDSQTYWPPVMANPGNYHTWDFTDVELAWHDEANDVHHVPVGGGMLGSRHAHENEAPYPEALVEFFVRSSCPPGGKVLDPFGGSGTTCAVAARHDRIGIGLDLRMSQCQLSRRRIADGLRPVSRLDGEGPRVPLPGQLDLFANLGDD